MAEIKAAIYDADGVLIVPQKLFSQRYAEKYGLNPEDFQAFFGGDFSKAVLGKADLKDLIRKNNHIWQWEGDPQELLDMWFESENHVDNELLALIKEQREAGLPVYIATIQEKHRAKYLREVMFPNVVDDIFVSSEIGYMKKDPEYWAAVLGKLAVDIPGIEADQVVFFDDSQDSVDGATQAGISAHLYDNVEQVKRVMG
jgi:putative hydrolase of the HAD superfamily